MSHTGPVEEALKFFEELLNEFEELVHRFRNNYTTHLSANPIAQV